MTSQAEHARALLARARDDLYVVQRLMEDAAAPAWALGFHAQQATEKALKAVLSHAGQIYPRTHNLDMLTGMLMTAGIESPPGAGELGRLTPFGVVLRYEDVPAEEFPGIDLAQLASVARDVTIWAEGWMNRSDSASQG